MRLDDPALRFRVSLVDRGTVAELGGDIDIATTAAVNEAFGLLIHQARPSLVVDLRAVTFMDSAILNILCLARRQALDRDGVLRVVSTRPLFARMLKITSLDTDFPLFPTVDAALPLPAGRRSPWR